MELFRRITGGAAIYAFVGTLMALPTPGTNPEWSWTFFFLGPAILALLIGVFVLFLFWTFGD